MEILSEKIDGGGQHTIKVGELEMQIIMVAMAMYAGKVDNISPNPRYCSEVREMAGSVTKAWASCK